MSASPAAYAFQYAGAPRGTADAVWICDDGGAETQGVWRFTFNSEDDLYVPPDPSYRAWSGGTCSDIVGQVSRTG